MSGARHTTVVLRKDEREIGGGQNLSKSSYGSRTVVIRPGARSGNCVACGFVHVHVMHVC